MEATSTVRTQASDTVDIIRETPDRSASYRKAAADTVAARGMAHQDLELAHPGRVVVEGALRRGRCGTDADSHAAPRRDPRARRDLRAADDALRRNGVRRVRGKCEVLGAGARLYVHRPCVKLLYRSYSKTSGDSDVLTSSIVPVGPVTVGDHFYKF